MKYCTNCGTKLEKGAKTCSYCGVELNWFDEDGEKTDSIDNKANNTTVSNINNQIPSGPKTNSLALAGFIVSLVSILGCCGSISIVSLILSIIGLSQIKKTNEGGKGFAIAGIIISVISIVISIIVAIIYGIIIVDEIS